MSTLTSYIDNTPAAVQSLGYGLRGLNTRALAIDLHAAVANPAHTTPLSVLRNLGYAPTVIGEYRAGRSHPVHIPTHDNQNPHTPATDYARDLEEAVGTFRFHNWLDAVNSLRAWVTAHTDHEEGDLDIPQALTDLLCFAGRPITIGDGTARHLAGAYSLTTLEVILDHYEGPTIKPWWDEDKHIPTSRGAAPMLNLAGGAFF